MFIMTKDGWKRLVSRAIALSGDEYEPVDPRPSWIKAGFKSIEGFVTNDIDR